MMNSIMSRRHSAPAIMQGNPLDLGLYLFYHNGRVYGPGFDIDEPKTQYLSPESAGSWPIDVNENLEFLPNLPVDEVDYFAVTEAEILDQWLESQRVAVPHIEVFDWMASAPSCQSESDSDEDADDKVSSVAEDSGLESESSNSESSCFYSASSEYTGED